MVDNFRFIFVLISLLMFNGTAYAANIKAYVDRDTLFADESFTLVYEAEGSVDDDPDFSPLELYFEILNQSQSSNMTLSNGNFSRKTVWTLVLLSKKPGSYTLPSIAFGKDRGPVLNINVKPAQQQSSTPDADIFLEVDVEPKTAYVQSQILYTVRLFRAIDIQSGSLSQPTLSDADAVVEKLGEDKRYQTTRHNRRYIIIERRYAIFPQQSGQLTIEPLEFTAQIAPQRRSLFGSMPFNTVTKRLYTERVELDVKPIPDTFSDKDWLPSREIQLVEEWPTDTPSFKVGEPVTRTIAIIADGLTAAQLPELAQSDIDGIKQYPDQPDLNDQQKDSGIIGIRQEKIALVPTQVGRYILPEIRIPWWNTDKHQMEIARIKPRDIVVAPAAIKPGVTDPSASLDTMPITEQTSGGITPSTPSSTIWPWLATLFGIGWLATALGWYMSGRRKSEAVLHQSTHTVKTSATKIKRRLQSACNQNRSDLVKQLLIEWAQTEWPNANINSLSDIAQRIEMPLSEQIQHLNNTLYSQHPDDWTGAVLWEQFQQYNNKKATTDKTTPDALSPLFKIQ